MDTQTFKLHTGYVLSIAASIAALAVVYAIINDVFRIPHMVTFILVLILFGGIVRFIIRNQVRRITVTKEMVTLHTAFRLESIAIHDILQLTYSVDNKEFASKNGELIQHYRFALLLQNGNTLYFAPSTIQHCIQDFARALQENGPDIVIEDILLAPPEDFEEFFQKLYRNQLDTSFISKQREVAVNTGEMPTYQRVPDNQSSRTAPLWVKIGAGAIFLFTIIYYYFY